MTSLLSRLTLIAVVVASFLPADLFGQGPPAVVPTPPVPLPVFGAPPTGSVTPIHKPNPDTGGTNTLNGSMQVEGSFQGSTPTGVATPEPLPMNLAEAVRRGLAYNLGVIGATEFERDAKARQRDALSRLLPDLSGAISVADEKVSLATLGLSSAKGLPPGFQFARVLGPFNYFDAGFLLSQRVFDLTAIRNYRSAKDVTQSADHNARDTRDLVVLAVGGSYLQVVAAAARVESAKAQLETARAVFAQATRQNAAGVNARIDVDRSQVEMQSQRLRLISLETDFATQKLSLGRIIGLPLGQDITLTTAMEYAPDPELPLANALSTALANRADLQAAEAQMRAAKQARDAARAQNVPTLAVNGSWAVAGENPGQANGVYSLFATLEVPIWRGGSIQANIASAEAVYAQRRAEYEDARGRVDVEVRTAFLRLAATNEQVAVANSNRNLAQSTLRQARDRFAAGVADTVEVVQAQESVATAEQDYIASLYAHYLAKLSLARSIGNTERGISTLLQPGRP